MPVDYYILSSNNTYGMDDLNIANNVFYTYKYSSESTSMDLGQIPVCRITDSKSMYVFRFLTHYCQYDFQKGSIILYF